MKVVAVRGPRIGKNQAWKCAEVRKTFTWRDDKSRGELQYTKSAHLYRKTGRPSQRHGVAYIIITRVRAAIVQWQISGFVNRGCWFKSSWRLHPHGIRITRMGASGCDPRTWGKKSCRTMNELFPAGLRSYVTAPYSRMNAQSFRRRNQMSRAGRPQVRNSLPHSINLYRVLDTAWRNR